MLYPKNRKYIFLCSWCRRQFCYIPIFVSLSLPFPTEYWPFISIAQRLHRRYGCCFNWNFIFSLAIICTEKPIHQINCAANSKLSLAITIENNLIIGAFLCLFCLLRMIENLRSFSTNSVVYVFFSLSPFKRFQFVLTREKNF